jgi:hypothetical protein
VGVLRQCWLTCLSPSKGICAAIARISTLFTKGYQVFLFFFEFDFESEKLQQIFQCNNAKETNRHLHPLLSILFLKGKSDSDLPVEILYLSLDVLPHMAVESES